MMALVRAGVVCAIIVAGLMHLLGRRPGMIEQKEEVVDPARAVVLRTPGGQLEVASLEKLETLAWSIQYNCVIVDCKAWTKPTVSEARAQVRYVYRIELAQQWTLKHEGDHYLLRVPALKPSLPVAFDTRKLEIKTTRGWLSPAAAPAEQAVLKHLGAELAARSQQHSNLALVRPYAEKTVQEFVRKWMLEQRRSEVMPVRVQFDGIQE